MQNFFHQPVKNDLKIYNIQQFATGQGVHDTTVY